MSTLISSLAVAVLWRALAGFEGDAPSIASGALFSWKGLAGYELGFGLSVDPLSIAAGGAIAFTGFLAVLYSAGFLAKEKVVGRHFALLNLAVSLELLLVMADSLFAFFVVWQVVAVIGIFIRGRVNAVHYLFEMIAGGALLLVMFFAWKALSASAESDAFQFSSIAGASTLFIPYARAIFFALLAAVAVRTVQLPFYIWMTDAFDMPLPAFGYVHATASVMSAVYLLMRFNFILFLARDALPAASILGIVAAVAGAFSALVQRDAQKMLAYVVIAEMGMALIGIGVEAYKEAMFHVFTYSFCITLVFFGVGSIASVTGSFDAVQPRGVRRHLPVTFWTLIVGALGISAVYPFAGFFGLAGICWKAYLCGHPFILLGIFAGLVILVIAVFRMVALLSFGKSPPPRQAEGAAEGIRIEESSVSMLVALVIAAFASIVAGWSGVQGAFGGDDHFGRWLAPLFVSSVPKMTAEAAKVSELALSVVLAIVCAHAAVITLIVYSYKRRWAVSLAGRFGRTHALFLNGFYVNAFYKNVIFRCGEFFSGRILRDGLDDVLMNGIIIGSFGRVAELAGEMLRRIRPIPVWQCIFWIVAAAVAAICWSVL